MRLENQPNKFRFDTAIHGASWKVVDQGRARLRCWLKTDTLVTVGDRPELQGPRQLPEGSSLREGGLAWAVVLVRGTARWGGCGSVSEISIQEPWKSLTGLNDGKVGEVGGLE